MAWLCPGTVFSTTSWPAEGVHFSWPHFSSFILLSACSTFLIQDVANVSFLILRSLINRGEQIGRKQLYRELINSEVLLSAYSVSTQIIMEKNVYIEYICMCVTESLYRRI